MTRSSALGSRPSGHREETAGTGRPGRSEGPGPQSRRPRSLGRLLRRTFGLLITLVLVSAAIAVVQGFRSSAAVNRLTGQVLPLQVANSQLLNTQGDAQRGLRNYLNFAQPGFQKLYYQARAQLPVQMRDVERHTADPRERALARELRRRMETWQAHADRSDAQPPGTPAARRSSDEAIELYNEFWTTSRKLQSLVSGEAERLQKANEHERFLSLVTLIGFAVVASAMALAVSGGTYRALIGPLRAMSDTLARLATGEHEARVVATGPAELHDVGRAINQLADESDRLRDAERERARMRQIAHDVGARVRGSLEVSTVLEEAVRALGEGLAAHHVLLHLIHDGRLEGADLEWRAGVISSDSGLPPVVDAERVGQAYSQHTYFSMRTSQIPPDQAPHEIIETFEAMPDSALLAVPFGAGGEALGAVVLLRPWAEGAWTAGEVLAIEVIAGDLGNGLQQARLYEQESRLVDELRALDLAKTDFLSTVSHELRSPLTSIVGYLELLRDEDAGSVTADQDQMLNAVERNTVRLQLLIEDLLTLSRIESGAFRSRLQPIDISIPIGSGMKTIRPLADAQGVDLRVDCPEGVLYISGDLHQLERAVLNLMSNAVKFSPCGGPVVLSGSGDDDSVTIMVTDTGMGIPEQDRQHMFNRFYRASNAVSSAIPGTGLGLTIVRSIVANHSGEMTLDSVEGQGTTVVLKLPRTDADGQRVP